MGVSIHKNSKMKLTLLTFFLTISTLLSAQERVTTTSNTQKEKIRVILGRIGNRINRQALVGNEVRWMNDKGEFIKGRDNVWRCGLQDTPDYFYEIQNKSKQIVFVKRGNINHKDSSSKSYFLTKYFKEGKLYFVNDTTEWNFSYINRKIFDNDTTFLLLFKKNNKKIDLVRLKISDKDIIHIEKAIEDMEAFASNIDDNAYIFKKNKLYGYYPLQKEAIFTKADRLLYFFARIELPNQQKGWIDINGKIYLDE
jgi:hypothetical protein